MVASINALVKYSRQDGKRFDGEYFLGLANANYWLEGGEPLGKWFGAATVKLGLMGHVDRIALQNLVQGLHPTGAPLMPVKKPRKQALCKSESNRRSHCPGFDVTFSAPKSVSSLWAVSDPTMRNRIEHAFDIAVTTTLQWLESNVPLARRGKAGHIKELAKLATAMFDHSVSRVGRNGLFEPQLHRHCLVMGVCEREDGSYGAINSPVLHKWVRTLGPMFRATLAEELRKGCGLKLHRPLDRNKQQQGWFEVDGVPDKLCRHWSSRKNEIDQMLETTVAGVKLGREHSTGQAREHANLSTRRAKIPLPPRGELFEQWQRTAGEFGFTQQKADRLQRTPRAISAEKVFHAAWQEAEAKLTQSHAHFTYREALQRVCEAAQDKGVSGVWLADRLKTYLEQCQEIIKLGEHKQETHYTTKPTWELEKKFLAEVKQLQETRGPVVDRRLIDLVIANKSTIAPDQEKAVRQLLSDDCRIRIMSGVAGAGKSYALDAVRDGLERAGYRVLGGALAAVAKEELAEKANLQSRTVASYLYQLDKSLTQSVKAHAQHSAKQLLRALQGKKTFGPAKLALDGRTVLIIDEAGMLDTRTLHRLARAVRKAGATLILVGDDKQLQPIEAGAPLAHLMGKLGHAHLTKNMRQKEELDRRASAAIREGRAGEAVKSFADRDRLIVMKDKKNTIERLVRDWSQHGGVKVPAQHVIFTQTRDEAKIVNRLCQRQRLTQGLSDESRSVTVGGERLCQGDRILFHKQRFADGIANGHRGTILQTNALLGRLTVQLDGREGEQPRSVTVRTRDYGPDGITLAYAQTTHKGQGQSVEHTYMLLGGSMTDREMSYVQATRGKLSTRLYVDDAHAGPELKDLVRAMNRSNAKLMAHDIASAPRHENDLGLKIERTPQP
jgi:conjugative relaxase-like TrwC/TraI family protein